MLAPLLSKGIQHSESPSWFSNSVCVNKPNKKINWQVSVKVHNSVWLKLQSSDEQCFRPTYNQHVYHMEAWQSTEWYIFSPPLKSLKPQNWAKSGTFALRKKSFSIILSFLDEDQTIKLSLTKYTTNNIWHVVFEVKLYNIAAKKSLKKVAKVRKPWRIRFCKFPK